MASIKDSGGIFINSNDKFVLSGLDGFPIFGRGVDGNVTFTSGNRTLEDNRYGSNSFKTRSVDAPVASVLAISGTTISVIERTGLVGDYKEGDVCLIINLQGSSTYNSNVGNWELVRVAADSVSGTIIITNPVTKNYGNTDNTSFSDQKVVIMRMPEYKNVVVDGAATTLTCLPWNGDFGGIVAFFAQKVTTINNGYINVASKGYRNASVAGARGEGFASKGSYPSIGQTANDNGGGGGQNAVTSATNGQNGTDGFGGPSSIYYSASGAGGGAGGAGGGAGGGGAYDVSVSGTSGGFAGGGGGGGGGGESSAFSTIGGWYPGGQDGVTGGSAGTSPTGGASGPGGDSGPNPGPGGGNGGTGGNAAANGGAIYPVSVGVTNLSEKLFFGGAGGTAGAGGAGSNGGNGGADQGDIGSGPRGGSSGGAGAGGGGGGFVAGGGGTGGGRGSSLSTVGFNGTTGSSSGLGGKGAGIALILSKQTVGLYVYADGQAGGNGGNGGAGGAGGTSQDGTVYSGPRNWLAGAASGGGGGGGAGGGGGGGSGGSILVVANDLEVQGLTAIGGSGGSPGSAGLGGNPGVRGNNLVPPHVSPTQPGQAGGGGTGRSGQSGGTGSNGRIKVAYLTKYGVYSSSTVDGSYQFTDSNPDAYKQSL